MFLVKKLCSGPKWTPRVKSANWRKIAPQLWVDRQKCIFAWFGRPPESKRFLLVNTNWLLRPFHLSKTVLARCQQCCLSRCIKRRLVRWNRITRSQNWCRFGRDVRMPGWRDLRRLWFYILHRFEGVKEQLGSKMFNFQPRALSKFTKIMKIDKNK